MVDINKYIVDGAVKRDRIVSDIKRGRISKRDIIELSHNSEIKAAYFGDTNLEKIDRNLWNETYLDEISLAAVSETFCEEYLLYLNDVAQYVIAMSNKKEQNNKIIKGIVIGGIIVLLIILAIAFIASKVKRNAVDYSASGIALAENTYNCLVKGLG